MEHNYSVMEFARPDVNNLPVDNVTYTLFSNNERSVEEDIEQISSIMQIMSMTLIEMKSLLTALASSIDKIESRLRVIESRVGVNDGGDE